MCLEQRIARHIVGMMLERLLVRQPRRTAIARVKEQRAQVREGAEMFAVTLDDLNLGVADRVAAPEHIERARTREQQPDIIKRPRQPGLDIPEILRIPKCGEHD